MGSSYYTDEIWFVLYLINNKYLSLFPTAQQLGPWPVTTSFKFWLSSKEKEFAKKEKHSSTFKLKIVLSPRQYALSHGSSKRSSSSLQESRRENTPQTLVSGTGLAETDAN